MSEHIDQDEGAFCILCNRAGRRVEPVTVLSRQQADLRNEQDVAADLAGLAKWQAAVDPAWLARLRAQQDTLRAIVKHIEWWAGVAQQTPLVYLTAAEQLRWAEAVRAALLPETP